MVCLNVLGLNCGTSIDGVDVALCTIESSSENGDVAIELLSYTELPISPDLRSRVLSLTRPDAPTTLQDVCDLNFALGEEFSRTVFQSGVDLSTVDIIASHGQTLWHAPNGIRKSTLQMAESAVIAHTTKKTVVSDFRVAEVAAGRQGAPLSGFFEAGVFSHLHLTRLIQNIGGIGNVTVVRAETSNGLEVPSSNHFEFDTGPGNVLIDAAVRHLSGGQKHYDKDGEAGERGLRFIDHGFVESFLQSPYFKQRPPKTTGRELFSEDLAKSIVHQLKSSGHSDDAVIATITRITAESIARAYEHFVIPQTGPIHEIYLCGGGAYNPNITKYLETRFDGVKVCKLDDVDMGISAVAKEAVLFALLGFLSVCGRRIPVPEISEKRDPAILGKITPGKNYHAVMRMVLSDPSFDDARPLARIGMKVRRQ